MPDAPPPSFVLASTLHRSALGLTRRLRVTRRSPDLTSASVMVLGLLRRDGGTLPSAIAKRLGVKPQSLTRVLADLNRRGLISRGEDAADGRRTPLRLTQAGDAALVRDMKARRIRLARAIDKLSPDAQALLEEAARLIDHLVGIIEPE